MMYFITEPGFCQHFFGNIFEIPEKNVFHPLFFYFLCISPALRESGRCGRRWAWRQDRPDRSRGGRGEQAAHAAHGVDDLITGDGVVHPGKGHICTGDGVHRANDIPLDAGNFHEAGHGVADEAQQVAQSHCGGSGALLQARRP